MKHSVIAGLALIACGAASAAELLVPKGAQGVMKVEYEFKSQGGYSAPSKNMEQKWSVNRRISLTAHYAADAPQPFGVLHAKDTRQQSDIRNLEAQAAKEKAKQEPMMNDMVAIAQACGMMNPNQTPEQAKAAEACVEKKVNSYADNMPAPTNVAQRQADISALAVAGGPRFQLWQMKSQTGSYFIEESHFKQIYEMTCTRAKACKRDETIKGGGDVPGPANGRSSAGSSMFEVDSLNKDLILQLPMPLAPLKVTSTVETSIPNEKGGVKDGFAKPWTLPLSKPITVRIPGDLRSFTGMQEVKIPGDKAEAGILLVRWTFQRT